MVNFIIRRIFLAVVVLILVTLIVFMAMRILPGDPIYMIMTSGEMTNATVQEIEAVRREFGLDKPLFMQYINWFGGMVHGDLGISIVQREPVITEIIRRVPITLNLSLVALFISLLIGIPAGIICALRRGKWIDTVVTVLANTGITIPVFWLGVMLVYVFSLQLHWLPVQGYTSPFVDLGKNIRQLIMPVFCLSIFPIASMARQTRSSMLEVMRQDYIRTAWSKGLKERNIVYIHALKNALIPVVTLLGMGLGNIIGGSVIVETVFNISGMGRMAVNAVFAQEYSWL